MLYERKETNNFIVSCRCQLLSPWSRWMQQSHEGTQRKTIRVLKVEWPCNTVEDTSNGVAVTMKRINGKIAMS